MSNHQFGAREFIIGAVIGGLVGTAGALLLAPQKSKRLRRELSDLFDNGSRFVRDFQGHAADWSGRAKSIFEEQSGSSRVFAIGALAGGVLGAVASLLLASKEDNEIQDDILDRYEDLSDRTRGFAKQMNKRGKTFTKTVRSKTHRWLDLAKDVVDELLDNGEDLTDHFSEKVKNYTDAGHDRLSDALEWASVGLKLWNTLSKRR